MAVLFRVLVHHIVVVHWLEFWHFFAELLFDYSCGLNEDLTYSGAERWLSMIPLETKASVYYYTTQVAI